MTYYTILDLGPSECLECRLSTLPEHLVQDLRNINMNTCYSYFADRMQQIDNADDISSGYYYLMSPDHLDLLFDCMDQELESPVIAEMQAQAQHQDEGMPDVWHSGGDVHIVRKWNFDLDVVQHLYNLLNPDCFCKLFQKLVTHVLTWKNFQLYRYLIQLEPDRPLPVMVNSPVYYSYNQQDIQAFLPIAAQSHKLELLCQKGLTNRELWQQIVRELDWYTIEPTDKIRITQKIITNCQTSQELREMHEAGFGLSVEMFCLDILYLCRQNSASRRHFRAKAGDQPLIYPEGVMLDPDAIKLCQDIGFCAEYFHVCYIVACMKGSRISTLKQLQHEVPLEIVQFGLEMVCDVMMQHMQLQLSWMTQGVVMASCLTPLRQDLVETQDYLLSVIASEDVADALRYLALRANHRDYIVFHRIGNVKWPKKVAQHLAECQAQAQALANFGQEEELQYQSTLPASAVKSYIQTLPTKSALILRFVAQSHIMLSDTLTLDVKDKLKCKFLPHGATTWAQYLIFVKICGVRAVKDMANSQGYVLDRDDFSRLLTPTPDKTNTELGICGEHDVCFYSALRSNFNLLDEICRDLWENDLLTHEVYARFGHDLEL